MQSMNDLRLERSFPTVIACSGPSTGTHPWASQASSGGAAPVHPATEANVFLQVVRRTDPPPFLPTLGPTPPQEAAKPRRRRAPFDLTKGRLNSGFSVPIFLPAGCRGEQVPLPFLHRQFGHHRRWQRLGRGVVAAVPLAVRRDQRPDALVRQDGQVLRTEVA